MPVARLLRIALALGIGLLFLLSLLALLYLTQSLFQVWEHLQRTPTWFLVLYSSAFVLLTGAVGWIIWRLLMPPARSKRRQPEAGRSSPPSEDQLRRRIEKADLAGVDVSHAKAELRRLQQRREAGEVHVSLFGEISSGKSSLIRALLPDAQVAVSARGGTTRSVHEYRWASPAGDELVLVDVPGTNEVDSELDELSRAEAQRSHLLLYVTDGDLTRSQNDELQRLLALDKPCVLALNKTDRYSEAELEQLKARLRDRLEQRARTEVVGVQAGGEREVLRVLPDGSEEMVKRPIPPRVDELRRAIQRRIDSDAGLLEELRDSAVFSLVASRLESAEAAHRREQSGKLVDSYARKAVVGALAAVTPGSDLIIQGYLGVSLIRDLSKLYEVPVRQVDRDRLLELVQQQVGKTHTLLLAVAGNAFKAFPGVGTLAGGLLHAVAYGMIFRTLGHAVANSFETRGELHPVQTAVTFKETLGEELEISARDFAALALDLSNDKHDRRAHGER